MLLALLINEPSLVDDRCHSAAAQGWQLGNRYDIIIVGQIKAHDESDE